jgi:imidazolonepropionase-like amidohydrolase
MLNPIRTRKTQPARQACILSIVILCLAFLVGCQPVATASNLATPTTAVDAVPAGTRTPASIPQTPIHTPTNTPFPAHTPIVLFGAIIDGTGAAPLEDAAIVIQDGVITAVGFRQEIEIPSGAVIIEFPGSTILPGFINAHVHTVYNPFLLKQWAQEGVTTVRDLGARYPFSLFPTRDRYNEDPASATLIAAGPLITVPRGYPIAGNNFPSLVVTNPDHARREVAELIREGADVIKIVVESGDGAPTLSLETASAIVETAHQEDVPVAAHVGTLDDLRLAVNAGVDDFSHVVPSLPEELLEQLVADNVYWVPTLETAGGYDAGNILRFIDAGGRIALGNDGGMLPGIEIGMPMREIEMLQAAGMIPMEIIVAATWNAAQVCNREDTLGTLEVGKIADVLVIHGDPLVDLKALRDVLLVIHQGVIIRDSIQP